MNILRYAWQNIKRNLSLSISSILAVGLLIFFVNILLFVLYASDEFIGYINNRIAIQISFKPGYTDKQVRSQDFINGIQQFFPGSQVTYISQQQGLDMLAERAPNLTSIVENHNDNPLPNSVRITKVSVADYEYLNSFITKYKDILEYDDKNTSRKLLDYKAQYEQIVLVVDMMKKLNAFVYVLIALFLATVFLIVNIIIRNFIQFFRNEISIIELVGGYPVFIYGPFVLQGVFYTSMGVVLAIAIFFSLQFLIPLHSFPFGSKDFLGQFYQYFLTFYTIPEILLAISIGIFSALFASYRYMDLTIRRR